MFVFAYFWDIFQCIYIYLHTHGNISNIIYMKQVEIMVSFTSVFTILLQQSGWVCDDLAPWKIFRQHSAGPWLVDF